MGTETDPYFFEGCLNGALIEAILVVLSLIAWALVFS